MSSIRKTIRTISQNTANAFRSESSTYKMLHDWDNLSESQKDTLRRLKLVTFNRHFMTELPKAINELPNLTELRISNSSITHLPIDFKTTPIKYLDIGPLTIFTAEQVTDIENKLKADPRSIFILYWPRSKAEAIWAYEHSGDQVYFDPTGKEVKTNTKQKLPTSYVKPYVLEEYEGISIRGGKRTRKARKGSKRTRKAK